MASFDPYPRAQASLNTHKSLMCHVPWNTSFCKQRKKSLSLIPPLSAGQGQIVGPGIRALRGSDQEEQLHSLQAQSDGLDKVKKGKIWGSSINRTENNARVYTF